MYILYVQCRQELLMLLRGEMLKVTQEQVVHIKTTTNAWKTWVKREKDKV